MATTLKRVKGAPKGMGLHEFIAHQEGFFAAEGLDVEIDWKTFKGTQSSWKDFRYFERPQDQPYTKNKEEVIQCALFDGNAGDAKLIGVEYIVSAELYRTLPAEEKQLWHSHVHEVRSGQLIAPGIPDPVERELMEKIVGTYGKTWHTWQTHHGQALPLGIPALMMGFTADGQANVAMVEDRDRRLDVSSSDKRTDRADIQYPEIDPDADAWQRGVVVRLDRSTGEP